MNDTRVGVTEGRAWAEAARQLVRDGGADEYRPALDRADTLLNDLRVAEFAFLSDVLPVGFDQRMRTFAAHLIDHVQAGTDETLTAVEEAANRVLTHVLAASQPQRADRVEMARRLSRWLLQPATTATWPMMTS